MRIFRSLLVTLVAALCAVNAHANVVPPRLVHATVLELFYPASVPTTGAGSTSKPASAPPPSFQGVGDIQSGAKGWIGILAYSAAYASALGNAFDFSCTGPGTGTVPFKSDGTLNLTGGISSCSGTISITKLYDQSGANYCGGSPCDVSTINSGTISFLQSGCPATTVITYCISLSGLSMKSAVFSDTAQPITWIVTADRTTGGRGSFNSLIGGSGGSQQNQMGASSTNDLAYIYDGSSIPTASMTDNALHTLGGIFHDATQSCIKVDNATCSNVSLGSTNGVAGSPTFGIGQNNAATGFFYGGGFYASDVGTTVLSNLANNMCTNSGSTSAPGC